MKEDGAWNYEVSSDLNTARYWAAKGFVVMNNSLVIAGGASEYYLDTIEVVGPNTESRTLPISLPNPQYGSCIVPWDDDTFMLIEGKAFITSIDFAYATGKTYFINMANNIITNGPKMLKGRYNFACHTLNINGDDYIIVAGGESSAKSTEILSKANYESGWIESKNGQQCIWH